MAGDMQHRRQYLATQSAWENGSTLPSETVCTENNLSESRVIVMKIFTALVVILLLQSCKYPLEIRGKGDIVDLNGSGHGCTLEQFQAADTACTENEVTGHYAVKYQGVPRAGWKFVRWEGPCTGISEPPYCELDIPASSVEAWDAQHPGVPFQATVAVFEPDSDSETVTYMRTVSTSNFLGWGNAGFYFPQFGARRVVGPKRTDDNMQFYVDDWLEFNFDPWDLNTTFSADKPDCFDNCSGRGVFTRGGYSETARAKTACSCSLPTGWMRTATGCRACVTATIRCTSWRCAPRTGMKSQRCRFGT